MIHWTCTTGAGCGQIHTITDALGHLTTVNAYDGNSRPTQITDPNLVVTNLTYWPRGWLKSIQVASETTNLTYWPTGQLETLSLPDGESLTYTYNAAHQLTQIQDQLGDKIVYTPDAMGNVTKTQVYDPSGTLTRLHTWNYNTLNQLLQSINSNGSDTTVYGFDNNGNLNYLSDPSGNNSSWGIDALNRIASYTDPNTGLTQFSHNALDQLTGVSDPRSVSTSYTINALDNVSQIVSPDSGTTNNTAFDNAGNLTSRTDANGKTTTYLYDALNRPTKITRADASVVNFYYDQGTNGIGHLTGMSDPSGSTGWSYDANGHLIQKAQTLGSINLTTNWSYSATTGQLQTMTLPSTKVISYTWTNGQITALKLNGAALLSNITYDTFDGPKSWTFANGQSVSIARDQNGRITSDAIESSVSYDPSSRITGITLGNLSSITGSNSYGYDTRDEINALSGSTSSGGAAGTWLNDAGGNRSNSTTGSASTVYTIATSSNRISQVKVGVAPANVFSYDADGSITADGTNTYTYDPAERLSTAKRAGATIGTYYYNGLGERVEKTFGTSLLFVYGAPGQLIGEYTSTGALSEETVYLGRLPVAVLISAGTYYVLTDHLGTPRQINNASSQPVWTWAPGPFGSLAANTNPSGLGTFNYNPRFPGQYYDTETNNFYNYQRDYNPNIGRYLESDPIGLKGGTNTYAYAISNPLGYTDPSGTDPILAGIGIIVGGGYGYINGVIAGDSGASLWRDVGAGAATGGLAGLTDGLSLLEGTVARASFSALIEIEREAANSSEDKGCVKINPIDVTIAAGGSLLGDYIGASTGESVAQGLGFMGLGTNAANQAGFAFSSIFAGLPALPISAVEASSEH